MVANRLQRVGVHGQPDDAPLVHLEELLRWSDTGHQGHVRGLVTEVAEEDRQRSLAGARRADEHDVGVDKRTGERAIIIADREVDGGDAREVVRFHTDGPSGDGVGFRARRGLQGGDGPGHEVRPGNVPIQAEAFNDRNEFIVDQGVEHGDGLVERKVPEHPADLIRVPHASVADDHEFGFGELGSGRSRDPCARLSRGVGDDVDFQRLCCHARSLATHLPRGASGPPNPWG